MGERLEFYLSFPGTAAQAAELYSKVFGQEIEMMRFGDFPPSGDMGNVDPDWIGHAQLVFENATMMFSDDPSGQASPANNFSVSWATTDEARLREVWQRFVDGGAKVSDELAPTFWAKLYGNLTDPFGVSWLLMYSDDNFEMPG